MTWFYSQMIQWHVLLAWCSVGIFFVRGLLFQFGTPQMQAIAKDARLMVLVFGVNACLLVTGPDGSVGHAMSLGRVPEKVRQAAVIDALCGDDTRAARIDAELIAPIEQALAQADERRRQETAATRVDFFTLVRGED